MRVRVSFHAQLRTAMGRSHADVELAEGASVFALLETLADQFAGNARTHLFANNELIRPSLMIVLNNAPLPHPLARETVLRDNDNVSLLPPIAGG